jgi:acid stress chaperone HdeB
MSAKAVGSISPRRHKGGDSISPRRRASPSWCLVVAVLFAASTAVAQPVDLSKLKCKEFIELPKDTAYAITVWLGGYFTDEDDPAVVNFDRLKVMAEKVGTFCAQNPRMSLMSAAESVMVK